MKQIITANGNLYQLIRALKEDQLKDPNTEDLKEYFLCDTVLRKQGLHIEDIESVVNRSMLDFGKNILKLHFILDIHAIAKKIKPLTRKYLANL